MNNVMMLVLLALICGMAIGVLVAILPIGSEQLRRRREAEHSEEWRRALEAWGPEERESDS